jgi:hypothetical protein
MLEDTASDRLEGLSAVLMDIRVVWAMIPCRLINKFCLFGGAGYLHLEGPLLLLYPEDGDSKFHREFGSNLPVNTASYLKRQVFGSGLICGIYQ